MSTSPPRVRKPINPWLLVVGVPFAVITVAFGGLFVVDYFTRGRLGPNDRRLQDGSILRIEKVTWGNASELEFEFEPPSWPWIWRRHVRKAEFNHQSSKRLVIWMSRRDSQTGLPLDMKWFDNASAQNAWGQDLWCDARRYAIAYDKVCVEPTNPTWVGLALPSSAQPLVASVAFFPFRTKAGRFPLHIRNSAGDVVATFEIDDPQPAVTTTWRPEVFPAMKADGDLTVTVHGMKWGKQQQATGQEFKFYLPDFTTTWKGSESSDWQIATISRSAIPLYALSDPIGSACSITFDDGDEFFGRQPSNHEPAWKLTLPLVRRLDANFSVSEQWALPAVTIPPTNTTTPRTDSRNVDGCKVTLFGVSGSGTFSYSVATHVFSSIGPLVGDAFDEPFRFKSKNDSGRLQLSGESKWPFMLFDIDGLLQSQRFDLLVKDDQGQEVPIRYVDLSQTGRSQACFLKMEPDAKSIRCVVIVQTAREFEFFVKPPKHPAEEPTQELPAKQ